jgi:hypothetical protein
MLDEGHDARFPSEQSSSGETDSQRSSTRFRFKSKSTKRQPDDDLLHPSRSSSHGQRRRHHLHHHRHKRGKLSPSNEANSASPNHENPSGGLDPEVAFRESLFDAMADDEGAEFWEGAYGQPIHKYADEKRNEKTGELEKMSEDEYIAHVRREMWKRSQEGIEAQREERRRERLREKQEQTRTKTRKTGRRDGTSEAAPSLFELEVEQSLRRGQERKETKMWQEKWNAYGTAWDGLHNLAKSRTAVMNGPDHRMVHLRSEIPWPVQSGKSKDVTPMEIERFMVKTAESNTATASLEDNGRQLLLNLKSERVRWHPDKVQHRFGSLDIDEGTLKGVTEVFQVLDRMYNERK